jgi:hypothetical protein
MIADGLHRARLVEAATVTELRHFALGAAFAPRVETAEGLSTRELGEVAKTFVAWKSADKALADYHARRRNIANGHSSRDMSDRISLLTNRFSREECTLRLPLGR